jgi:hypothetical protein
MLILIICTVQGDEGQQNSRSWQQLPEQCMKYEYEYKGTNFASNSAMN